MKTLPDFVLGLPKRHPLPNILRLDVSTKIRNKPDNNNSLVSRMAEDSVSVLDVDFGDVEVPGTMTNNNLGRKRWESERYSRALRHLFSPRSIEGPEILGPFCPRPPCCFIVGRTRNASNEEQKSRSKRVVNAVKSVKDAVQLSKPRSPDTQSLAAVEQFIL
ncbi:hypothetical protein WG66_001580 [Moniliophthora roreri]|nr:hypothetical protein WG66_001580 [Moniliophthora roreri]